TLTRVKTLNGIVDRLLVVGPAVPDVVPATPPLAASPAVIEIAAELSAIESSPRFQIKPFREPLAQAPVPSLNGLFLITEDELAVAPLVAQGLARLGARPGLLERAALADPAVLDARIKALTAEHGPVAGFVHLAPLSRRRMPDGLGEWRALTTIDVKALYHLLHSSGADLVRAAAKGQAWLLAATAMGSSYGRDGTDTGGA